MDVRERIKLAAQVAVNRSHAEHARDQNGDSTDAQFLDASFPSYEIIHKIQQGGQGAVYEAVHRSTNRTVAIKLLYNAPSKLSRQQHRFEREMGLLSSLHHPNIVTLHDAGSEDGRQYLIMEYVGGLSIDDYVLLEDFSIDKIVELFIPVCKAVAYAHQQGVIHRDIKPSNILIDDKGSPRVCDFGLATFVTGSPGSSDAKAVSLAGQLVGTPAYMSLERMDNPLLAADTRSDVYSLGVVLFELLTGKLPFPMGPGMSEWRDTVCAQEPEPLEQALSEDFLFHAQDRSIGDLSAIVRTALCKDVDKRYQTAGELAGDLQRYLDDEPVKVRSDSTMYVLRKMARKHRGLIAAGAGVMVLFVVAAVAVTSFWLKARADRDNARATAMIAQSTIDDVARQIDELIRPLAGGAAVRDKIFKLLLPRLDELEARAKQDVAMGGVLNVVHEKQGDIAFLQGRLSDAEQRFAMVRDATATSDPLMSARALRKLGIARSRSTAEFATAIGNLNELARREPSSNEPKAELCQTHVEFSRRLNSLGRIWESLDQANLARQLADKELSANASDDHWREQVGSACDAQAKALEDLQILERADEAARRSVAIHRELSLKHPFDAERRLQLMVALMDLGNLFSLEELSAEGKNVLVEAVNIGHSLVSSDGSIAEWKLRLSTALFRLSWIEIAQGRFDDANPHVEEVNTLLSDLFRSNPSDREVIRRVAQGWILRGSFLMAAGLYDEAGVYFDEAIDFNRSEIAKYPGELRLRQNLADYLYDKSTCLVERARCAISKEGAHALLDESYECQLQGMFHRRVLAEVEPDNFMHASLVIVSMMSLGAAELRYDLPKATERGREWCLRARSEIVDALCKKKYLGSPVTIQKKLQEISKNLNVAAVQDRRRPGQRRR